MSALTPRELEVCEGLTKGESRKEIAERLAISVSTVRAHIDRIYHKIGGRGRPRKAIASHFLHNRLRT